MKDAATSSDRVLVVRCAGLRRAVPLHLVLAVREAGPAVRLPGVALDACAAVAHGRDVIPLLRLRDAGVQGVGQPAAPASPADPGRSGPAALVVVVRRAGRPVALGISGVEGVQRAADTDAPLLDTEALAVPAAQPRPPLRSTGARAGAARAAAPAPSGLRVAVGGRVLWLRLGLVERVLDAAAPLALPWGPPLVPSMVVLGGVPVPLLRLELLLGVPAPAPGPVVVCRTRQGLAAFAADRVEGLHPQGTAELLDLDALLHGTLAEGAAAASRLAAPALGTPGAAAGTPVPRGTDAPAGLPAPVPEAQQAAAAAYLGVVMAGQLCLLPLGLVRRLSPHVPPTRLPGAPAHLMGVRASGGRVLPVVDLRAGLGLPRDAAPRVDVEVAPAGEAPFLLAACAVDGLLRVAACRFRDLGAGMAAAAVRLDGRTAWLLAPSALAPALAPALAGPLPPRGGAFL